MCSPGPWAQPYRTARTSTGHEGTKVQGVEGWSCRSLWEQMHSGGVEWLQGLRRPGPLRVPEPPRDAACAMGLAELTR